MTSLDVPLVGYPGSDAQPATWRQAGSAWTAILRCHGAWLLRFDNQQAHEFEDVRLHKGPHMHSAMYAHAAPRPQDLDALVWAAEPGSKREHPVASVQSPVSSDTLEMRSVQVVLGRQ